MLLLKHFIFETVINLIFESIEDNFSTYALGLKKGMQLKSITLRFQNHGIVHKRKGGITSYRLSDYIIGHISPDILTLYTINYNVAPNRSMIRVKLSDIIDYEIK